MPEMIKVKQIRSAIGYEKSQAETLRGLGLGKINRVRELKNTPEIRGMIRKVQHLVEIVTQ